MSYFGRSGKKHFKLKSKQYIKYWLITWAKLLRNMLLRPSFHPNHEAVSWTVTDTPTPKPSHCSCPLPRLTPTATTPDKESASNTEVKDGDSQNSTFHSTLGTQRLSRGSAPCTTQSFRYQHRSNDLNHSADKFTSKVQSHMTVSSHAVPY